MKLNKNVRLVLAVILGLLLAILVFQNMATITLSFLGWHLSLPLFGVVLISVGIGFLLGKLLRVELRSKH